MAMKLVAIEKPEVPSYAKGVFDGLEAGYRLGIMVACYCEGYGGKGMGRLLVKAISPGRNLDASIIKTPI